MSGTADNPIRAKLRSIETEISELRGLRADAVREVNAAKDAFAGTKNLSTDSAEYRNAASKTERLREIDVQLEAAQAGQVGVLKLISDDPISSVSHGDARELARLKSEPGRWLAAVLDRRKGEVQRLPDEIRFKALSTGANVSTVEESEAVIDLLTPSSVALASGIQALRIDSTETKIPRFTSLPVAAWRNELAPFAKNEGGLEQVTAKPPSVGLISTLSIELFDDLSPLALAMVQTQMLRAVALAFDKGLLFGSGTAPEPRGVANTPGILAETDVPLTSLAGFATAIDDLIATNAVAGALVMNPLDLGTLLGLTEDATSNVPLWKSAISGGEGLKLPYFGVPLYVTAACPQGEALLYDPATVIAVIRREADVAVDPYCGFDNGEIGLRVYVRGMPVVGQPTGAVKITFEA